jgi:hypothetical protein
MFFDRFRGDEKSPFIDYDFVDVACNSSESVNGGVVVGRDGNLIASSRAIKVFLLRTAPQDAGQFPLRAEGNLTGGTGKSEGAHWRIKANDTAEKRLEIQVYPESVIGRGEGNDGPKVTVTVWARDEQGRPTSSVQVLINVSTDIGLLQQGWRGGATGGSPPRYTALNDALPKPQDNAKKFILKATAEGYTDAEVEVPIVMARWDLADDVEEGKGLDVRSDPPWLVVTKNATSNAAALVLDGSMNPANVAIASENPGVAGISPSAATGEKTPTPVTGITAGPASAKATSNGVLARLQITVKNPLGKEIKFVLLKDQNGHSATLTEAQRTDLTADASSLLGIQSGVTFEQATDSGKTFEVTGDLGDNPAPESLRGILGDVVSQEGGGGAMVVVVVWAMDGGGGFASTSGGCIIDQSADDEVLSHELTHNLGRYGHSNDEGTLMAPGSNHGLGGGRILRPYEADIINR